MSDLREIGTTQAIINKVTTTVDGGMRLTLDIYAESEIISRLIDIKMNRDQVIYVSMFEKNDA